MGYLIETGNLMFGTYERVDPSWIPFNQSNPGATSPNVADIGLITLNRSIGNLTGEFAIGYNNNNASFTGETFQTAGYPSLPVLKGPEMFTGSGKAIGTVSNDGISFTQSSLPALPGQSGSPLWQTSANGSHVIYGVLTGANGGSLSSQVYAARITQGVYNELKSWEKADKTPPIYSNVTLASQVHLQHPGVAARQAKGAVSSTPAIHALDDGYGFGWSFNASTGVYSGSYGYSPITGYGSSFGGSASPYDDSYGLSLYGDGSLQATVPFSAYGLPMVYSGTFSPYSTTVGLGIGYSNFNLQGTYTIPYGYQDAYNGLQDTYNNVYNTLGNWYDTASDPDYWMSSPLDW